MNRLNQPVESKMKLEDIVWSKRQWEVVKVGGTWAVPRSGMMFGKTARGFELIDVMPYLPEMAEAAKRGQDVPKSAKELRDYQRADFDCMRRHFETAGLTFTDPKKLLDD